MKSVSFALLSLLLFTGCDYAVRLADAPQGEIPPAWLGVWDQQDVHPESNRLVLLPMGSNELFLSFPAGADESMYARAIPIKAAGLDLMQLTWIGNAKGKTIEKSPYQYALVVMRETDLVVRLINADQIARTAKAPEELIAAIAAAKDDPKLWRKEMVFTRAEP